MPVLYDSPLPAECDSPYPADWLQLTPFEELPDSEKLYPSELDVPFDCDCPFPMLMESPEELELPLLPPMPAPNAPTLPLMPLEFDSPLERPPFRLEEFEWLDEVPALWFSPLDHPFELE